MFHFPPQELSLCELFHVTTLTFELELIMCQEFICLAQRNNEAKLPRLPLLGDKKLFKIDKSSPIVVVSLYITMAIVAPVFTFPY